MALWIILGAMAFMLLAGGARGRGGVAFADVTVLVMLLGLIAIADLVIGRFTYTGDAAWTVAALLAGGFAVDALYGFMAPERQRRRDEKLRQLLRRRRRA